MASLSFETPPVHRIYSQGRTQPRSPLVQLKPERQIRRGAHDAPYHHDHRYVRHQIHIDHVHFLEELEGLLVVTVEQFFGARQVLSVQTVDRINDALESGAVVTNVVDPTEKYRGVDVAHAKTEY